MEGVGPVKTRLCELGDRLHTLFAHRQEARVRRQLRGHRLGLLGLGDQRSGLHAAARDLMTGCAVEQGHSREPGQQDEDGVGAAFRAAGGGA